ncbi:hypothetical protein BKA70DRAFT_1451311 [Coprinopsis sp. MPI-PUGE-AT-0042]|nr:hypothetical protein BKA70DRAFT_1451311 [Coprinopsis sp. MPI-PUGE-AT-0042]
MPSVGRLEARLLEWSRIRNARSGPSEISFSYIEPILSLCEGKWRSLIDHICLRLEDCLITLAKTQDALSPPARTMYKEATLSEISLALWFLGLFAARHPFYGNAPARKLSSISSLLQERTWNSHTIWKVLGYKNLPSHDVYHYGVLKEPATLLSWWRWPEDNILMGSTPELVFQSWALDQERLATGES